MGSHGTPGIPWDPRGEPMGSHGIPREPMGSQGAAHGIPGQASKNPWGHGPGPMGTHWPGEPLAKDPGSGDPGPRGPGASGKPVFYMFFLFLLLKAV